MLLSSQVPTYPFLLASIFTPTRPGRVILEGRYVAGFTRGGEMCRKGTERPLLAPEGLPQAGLAPAPQGWLPGSAHRVGALQPRGWPSKRREPAGGDQPRRRATGWSRYGWQPRDSTCCGVGARPLGKAEPHSAGQGRERRKPRHNPDGAGQRECSQGGETWAQPRRQHLLRGVVYGWGPPRFAGEPCCGSARSRGSTLREAPASLPPELRS